MFERLLNLEPVRLDEHRAEITAAFPEIAALEGCAQDAEWHAEGDVWTHTQHVLDAAAEILPHLPPSDAQALHLAALLHDLGKPRVCAPDESGRIRCPGHARLGGALARTLLHRVGVPAALREATVALIQTHHHPGRLVRQEAGWLEYFRLSHLADTSLLFHLEQADFRGRQSADRAEQLDILEEFRLWCEEYDCYGQPGPNLASEALLDEVGLTGPQRTRLCGEVLSRMAWGMLTSEGQARAYLYENRGRAGGEFYLTVGLPASGKTQWIADHLDARVVSMDRRRAGRSRRDNPRVFHEAWEELKQALHHRERVVWDATNITEEKRQRLISLARDQHAFITLIYLDTPLPVALERNRQRDEVVPEKVIRRYAEELEPPRPWEYDELVWGEE